MMLVVGWWLHRQCRSWLWLVPLLVAVVVVIWLTTLVVAGVVVIVCHWGHRHC